MVYLSKINCDHANLKVKISNMGILKLDDWTIPIEYDGDEESKNFTFLLYVELGIEIIIKGRIPELFFTYITECIFELTNKTTKNVRTYNCFFQFWCDEKFFIGLTEDAYSDIVNNDHYEYNLKLKIKFPKDRNFPISKKYEFKDIQILNDKNMKLRELDFYGLMNFFAFVDSPNDETAFSNFYAIMTHYLMDVWCLRRSEITNDRITISRELLCQMLKRKIFKPKHGEKDIEKVLSLEKNIKFKKQWSEETLKLIENAFVSGELTEFRLV